MVGGLSLKTGDLFCTKNPMKLGSMINWWQKIISADGKSKYSHAGIIMNSAGDTFESVRTNTFKNIYKDHADNELLIARYPKVDNSQWRFLLNDFIKDYGGKRYPYHRVLLNLFPPLAKRLTFGKKNLVCSELVGEFLSRGSKLLRNNIDDGSGYIWPRHKYSTGTTPDMLADEWHRWRDFEIIFEGILNKS